MHAPYRRPRATITLEAPSSTKHKQSISMRAPLPWSPVVNIFPEYRISYYRISKFGGDGWWVMGEWVSGRKETRERETVRGLIGWSYELVHRRRLCCQVQKSHGQRRCTERKKRRIDMCKCVWFHFSSTVFSSPSPKSTSSSWLPRVSSKAINQPLDDRPSLVYL